MPNRHEGFYNNKGLGQGLGQNQSNLSTTADLPQNATSAFKIPSYFPYGNLRVLVSPFMPFDLTTKVTDIILCNSQNLGALIVKDEPHVKSWDEPQYDIHNVGIEESYGFGVLNEGQGIAVIKNVKVTGTDPVFDRSLFVTRSQSNVARQVREAAGRRCRSGSGRQIRPVQFGVVLRLFLLVQADGSGGC